MSLLIIQMPVNTKPTFGAKLSTMSCSVACSKFEPRWPTNVADQARC